MPHLDLSRSWQIVLTSSHPTAALAMTELALTLRRIVGRPYVVRATVDGRVPCIVLAHGQGDGDGFRWQVGENRVELRGDGPRGLLYAVYDFLEALGCRWVAPGPGGERLPSGTHFVLPDRPVVQSPAIKGRCLILGHYAFLQDAEAWVIWAARNRLNAIFVHVTAEQPAFGAAPESQWQRKKETVIPLARQRGMTVEHGGHGLAALLPRELFAPTPHRRGMPHAFRYHQGRRRPDHNFCPTSAEGLAIIRRNAATHFRTHSEADIFHLWPDDVPGGGWCSCERCLAYSPSEQALLAVNAVAEVLEEINPQAQISFLAYMDTEDVPVKVLPRSNVCLLWAPRSRCYAHSTEDPTCAVNLPHYAQTFRAQVQHFRAAKPPRVFEYYLDAILFKSVLPPLPTVMQRDLRFYRQAGAHTVQALMTGDRPWLSPQLTPWLFARLAWNPDQDIDALLEDFGHAAFGSSGWGAYYRALEKAFMLALDIVPEQVKLDWSFSPRELLEKPFADMGDPVHAPPEVLRQKVRANGEIKVRLAEAARHLELAQEGADRAAWAAERAEFELTRAWLLFDLARVRLYEAVSTRPIRPDAYQRFKDAQSALNAVRAWSRTYLTDGRFRANFELVHLIFWQLRLDKIAADHFAWRPTRHRLQTRDMLRLARLYMRMRKAYV